MAKSPITRLDNRPVLYGEPRLTDPQARALGLLAMSGNLVGLDARRQATLHPANGYPHFGQYVVAAPTIRALRQMHLVEVVLDAVRITPKGRELLVDIGLATLCEEVVAERAASAPSTARSDTP
jgi:hypothetical protein